jgi:hypothetical protein
MAYAAAALFKPQTHNPRSAVRRKIEFSDRLRTLAYL